MKEQQCIRGAILLFWVFFWGFSVVDKVIPDVQHLWVGKDFFALFVKFFASLGLSDPRFATVAALHAHHQVRHGRAGAWARVSAAGRAGSGER